MNQVLVFELLILAALLVFALPKALKHWFTVLVVISLASLTSYWSFGVLLSSEKADLSMPMTFSFWSGTPLLVIDKLSAFFILVVNFTAVMGSIYAGGYLKAYSHRSIVEFSLHYFAYMLFHASMLLIPMLRDALSFFTAWELMSVSAFVLVIFDYEHSAVLRAGVKFLIYMHICIVILMFGFFFVHAKTGLLSFEGLQIYFSNYPNLPIFLVFFVGFGIKCGFFPLHIWLPHADTAAPAHVAALMSGVAIKMGFYGLLRVLSYVHQDHILIGTIIFSVSIITGLYGITKAVLHHNLKTKLAYSTVENAGIIGIGIGLGMLGIGLNNKVFAMLCLLGSMMHILNHSLFKSLLFFGEGAIYKKLKTRYIESFGGLLKKMPHTGILFLIASLSVCGLPPFNGFISEFLMYSGILRALDNAGMYKAAALLAGLIGLSLIGGISIFAFAKTYSTVFLGSPRTMLATQATEVGWQMLLPKYIIAFVICVIGIAPSSVIPILFDVIKMYVTIDMRIVPRQIFNILEPLSIIMIFFWGLVVFIFVIRLFQQRNKVITVEPTWGCGYVGSTNKMQYTSTSFSDNFLQLVKPIAEYSKDFIPFEEEDIFPKKGHTFKATAADKIENMYSKPVDSLLEMMKKATIFQTGSIQHYIMYGFIFIILIFVLTFFKVI